MNDFLKKLKWIHICVIITMMSQSLVYGQGVVNDQTAGRHLAPKSQIESMLDEGRSRDDKKKAETILTLLDQEEFQGIRDLIRQRQPKILQSEDMYEVEAQVTEFLVNEMERGNPMQDAILSEKAEYAVYKDFRKEAGLEQTGREASLAGRTGRVAEYESHYSKRRTAYESIFVKSPDSQENDGGLNAATADRFFTVLDNAMLYHQFFQALLTLPIELKGRQALRFERDRGRRESRLITVIINAVQKIREANQELGEQAVLISQEVLGDIILKGVKARNTEAAELIEELEALQRKLPGGEKEADYEAARQAAELADIHIREIQGVVRNEDGKIQDLLINSAQIIEIKTQIQTWRTALSTNEREQQQYAGVQSEEAVAAMGTLNEAHQTLSGLITSLEASLTALMQTGNEFNDAHRQSRTSVGLYDEQIRQAYSLAEKYQGSPDGSRELAVFEKAQEALQALEKEQQNLLWLDQLGSKLTGLYFNLSMTFEAQAALDEQFNQAYYALLETSFMRETAEQTAQEVKKRLDALSAWFANSLPFHGIAEGINPLDETTPQITDLLNHLYGPDMATANPDIHRAAQDLLLNYEAVVLQPFMAVREREIAFWGSTAHAPVEIAPAFVSLFQEAGITVVPMEDNKVQMDYPHCLDDAVAYLVQMNRLITEAQGLFVEGNLPQENVEKYNELVSMYTVLAQGGINLLNSIIFSIRFRSFSPEVIQMKAEARPIAVNLLEEFSRRLAEITQITDRQGIQPPTVESPSPLPQEPAEPTVQPSSDTSTAEPAPAGEPGTPLPAESPIAEPEIPIDVVIDAAVDTAQTLADEETQADQQGGTGARARVRNLIWRILGGAGIVLLCIAIPAGVIAGPAAGGVAVWLTSNTVFVFLLVAFAAALLFYIASYIKFKKLPSLRGLLGSMFLGSVAGGIVIGLIKLYAAYPIIGAILIGVAVLFILWLLGVEKGLWRILSKYVFTRANLKRLIFVVAAIAIGASLGVGGLTVWNLWAMNKAFSIGMGAALAGILILTGIAYFKTSETPPDWMGRIGRGSLWLAKKSVTLGLIGLIGFGVFKVYAAGGILAALGVGAPALLVAIALVFGISGLRTFFRGIGRFFRGVSNVISWKGAVILLGSFGVPLFLGWVAITHASILPFLGLAILGAAVLFLLWKYLGFSRTLFVLSAAALLTTIFVLWSIPSWYLVPVLAVVLLAAILWDYFKISDAIRKSSPWVKFGLALTAIGAPIALLVALGLPQAPPAGTGEEGGAKVTMSSAARKQIAERQAEETKAAFEQSAQQLPDLGIPGYTSPPPEKANYAGNIILTFLEDNGFPENPESPELEDFLDGIDNHIRTGGTFNHTPGDDNSVDNKLTSFRSQLEANNLAPDVVEQAVDALEIYLNQHVQDEAPAPAPDVTPSPDQPAPPTAAPTPDQPPAPEAAPAPAAPVVKKIVTYAPTDLTDAQTAEAVSAINTIQAESNSSSKPVLNNYLNILKGDMEASNNKGQGLYEDLRHFEDNRETWKLWVQQNLRLARDKGEISEDEMINLKAELFGILGKLPVPNRYVKTVTVNAPADGTAGPAAGTTTARTPRAKAPADTAAQAAAAARVITEGAAEANAQEAAPQPAQPVVARVVSPTGADSTATAPATEPEAKPLSYAQLEKLRQEALNVSIPALVLQIRDILIPDLQIEIFQLNGSQGAAAKTRIMTTHKNSSLNATVFSYLHNVGMRVYAEGHPDSDLAKAYNELNRAWNELCRIAGIDPNSMPPNYRIYIAANRGEINSPDLEAHAMRYHDKGFQGSRTTVPKTDDKPTVQPPTAAFPALTPDQQKASDDLDKFIEEELSRVRAKIEKLRADVNGRNYVAALDQLHQTLYFGEAVIADYWRRGLTQAAILWHIERLQKETRAMEKEMDDLYQVHPLTGTPDLPEEFKKFLADTKQKLETISTDKLGAAISEAEKGYHSRIQSETFDHMSPQATYAFTQQFNDIRDAANKRLRDARNAPPSAQQQADYTDLMNTYIDGPEQYADTNLLPGYRASPQTVTKEKIQEWVNTQNNLFSAAMKGPKAAGLPFSLRINIFDEHNRLIEKVENAISGKAQKQAEDLSGRYTDFIEHTKLRLDSAASDQVMPLLVAARVDYEKLRSTRAYKEAKQEARDGFERDFAALEELAVRRLEQAPNADEGSVSQTLDAEIANELDTLWAEVDTMLRQYQEGKVTADDVRKKIASYKTKFAERSKTPQFTGLPKAYQGKLLDAHLTAVKRLETAIATQPSSTPPSITDKANRFIDQTVEQLGLCPTGQVVSRVWQAKRQFHEKIVKDPAYSKLPVKERNALRTRFLDEMERIELDAQAAGARRLASQSAAPAFAPDPTAGMDTTSAEYQEVLSWSGLVAQQQLEKMIMIGASEEEIKRKAFDLWRAFDEELRVKVNLGLISPDRSRALRLEYHQLAGFYQHYSSGKPTGKQPPGQEAVDSAA